MIFFKKMGFLIVFEGAKRLQLKLHVFSILKESGEAVSKFLFLDYKYMYIVRIFLLMKGEGGVRLI